MTHLQNADGQGQLIIGDHVSPITYHVAVEKKGAGYAATVAMHAPRDWLIRQGFKRRATLVFASGRRAELEHGGTLDVSDSLSVVLHTDVLEYDDRERLIEAFPEMDGSAT